MAPNFHFLPWQTACATWSNPKCVQQLIPASLKNELRLIRDTTSACILLKQELGFIQTRYTLNANDMSKVLCYLLPYCVLDVASLLQRPLTKGQEQPSKGTFTQSNDVYGKHMSDWVRLLREGMSRVKQPSPSAHVTGFTGDCVMLRLLHQLCKGQRTLKKEKIYHNFMVAALHLRYMLEGHVDLPETLSELVSYMKSSAADIPLEYLMLKISTSDLKRPLQMALTTSPVCLFIPLELTAQKVPREFMFNVWKARGRSKPFSLRCVERVLWHTVFEMAQTGGDAEGSVNSALGSIQATWLDDDTASYFAPDTKSSTVDTASSAESESTTGSCSNARAPPEGEVGDGGSENSRSTLDRPLSVDRFPPSSRGGRTSSRDDGIEPASRRDRELVNTSSGRDAPSRDGDDDLGGDLEPIINSAAAPGSGNRTSRKRPRNEIEPDVSHRVLAKQRAAPLSRAQPRHTESSPGVVVRGLTEHRREGHNSPAPEEIIDGVWFYIPKPNDPNRVDVLRPEVTTSTYRVTLYDATGQPFILRPAVESDLARFR
ncbi:hypothetical protein BDN72DRAFT_848069 [Pluteus cervinus]|uniref:Uncharacterized protein n=1 Tax=Pluteus cervinus TaxID=181527 RepID=A0ACD3AC18_9AGAR|nr:hypothetical protein BDN72DRAFT_848069 [Pluteus cervinus]